MNEINTEKVADDPRFRSLVARRARFAWVLAGIVMLAYFGFIILVAFAPGVLGIALGSGVVTTIGIPIGILIIVLAFALTGLYVYRSNTKFDAEMAELLETLS